MSLRYRNNSGEETIIAGLTPGGDIEAGAVMTRTGTVSNTSVLSAGGQIIETVTFDSPMPDSDYEVTFEVISGAGFIPYLYNNNTKTKEGFQVVFNRFSGADVAIGNAVLKYTAFKIYTVQHAQQNAEDLATIQAAMPTDASSINKLTTKAYVDNANNALDLRVDAVEDLVPAGASITNQLVTTSEIAKDTTPMIGSSKLITSGGVYTALEEKQDVLTFDSAPTAGSTNPVRSNGIKTAIDNVAVRYDFSMTGTSDKINDIKALLNALATNKPNNGSWFGDFIRVTVNAGSYNVSIYTDSYAKYIVGTCVTGIEAYTIYRQDVLAGGDPIIYIKQLANSNPLKTYTCTGTTDGYGNLVIPQSTLNYINHIVISLIPTNNTTITLGAQHSTSGGDIPYYYGHVMTYAGAAVTNTSVTFDVIYMSRNDALGNPYMIHTVTGTTDGAGNLLLNDGITPIATTDIINIIPRDNRTVTLGKNSQIYYAHVMNYAGANVQSQTVTVDVIYKMKN